MTLTPSLSSHSIVAGVQICAEVLTIFHGLCTSPVVLAELCKVEGVDGVSAVSARCHAMCTAVYLSFGSIGQSFYCFCDARVRERAWRSHKRVAQAT